MITKSIPWPQGSVRLLRQRVASGSHLAPRRSEYQLQNSCQQTFSIDISASCAMFVTSSAYWNCNTERSRQDLPLTSAILLVASSGPHLDLRKSDGLAQCTVWPCSCQGYSQRKICPVLTIRAKNFTVGWSASCWDQAVFEDKIMLEHEDTSSWNFQVPWIATVQRVEELVTVKENAVITSANFDPPAIIKASAILNESWREPARNHPLFQKLCHVISLQQTSLTILSSISWCSVFA